jgi:hypothetical protein
MNEDNAENLITYSRENNRVCPEPSHWNELWEMLPDRHRIGSGWEPPLPLILGAWNYTSNLEKMMRLSEHIRWADEHGKLEEVSAFLKGLKESDWHHLRD